MNYDDIRYAPYLRHFWSLRKNVRKGKWKSLLRRFYDAKYRADMNHQWKVTAYYGKLATFHTTIPLEEIFASHDVNYPEWVLQLRAKLRYGRNLPPIKVIWDPIKWQWMCVDGNHRLAAYKIAKDGEFDVPVIMLYPQGGLDTYGPILIDKGDGQWQRP